MNNHIYKKGLVVVLIIILIVMTSVGIKLSYKREDIIFNNLKERDVSSLNSVSSNDKGVEIQEEKQIIIIDIDGCSQFV